MPRDNELDALRAEVRRRQKAANDKVYRLKRRGIEVQNTGHDIRRDLSKTKTYNKTQLRAYIGQLNSFVDRKNAFVPGHKGVPIPARVWRENVREQQKLEAAGKQHYKLVKGFKLPGQDARVKDRDKEIRSKRRAAMAGEAVARPYDMANRVSRMFTSDKAVEKLTRDLKRKNRPDYLPRTIKRQRGEMMSMLKEMGNLEQMERFAALTDFQFDVAFNYTSLATEASRGYAAARLMGTETEERFHAGILEDSGSELNEILGWAEMLPKTRAERQAQLQVKKATKSKKKRR